MTRALRFPEGFLWGTATSSHQVEGDNRNNDWWTWERRPGAIRDGERSGAAAAWWSGRAEEDLSTAAELGQNAHRLSLEWSRLEPEPGVWNLEAFERYRRLFQHAKAQGVAMMVTLNHFTLPRWAAERGGWLDRSLPDRFANLARECARWFSPYVDLWATLNEPNALALLGYAWTRWPPGLGRLRAYGPAMANQLQAHRLAHRAIHRVEPRSAVGLVLNMPLFEPSRPHPADYALARMQDWWMNGAVLASLQRGALVPPLSKGLRRIPQLGDSLDWVGLNYYGRYLVRFDPLAPSTWFSRFVQQPTTATAWSDWGQPYPEGLTRQILRIATLGVPVYVTENGIYDNEDERRPEFLRTHVKAVHDALELGADVRGYFHWSLVDNFEWAEGWSTKFGLLELDRSTGARRRKRSADVYARICRENALIP